MRPFNYQKIAFTLLALLISFPGWSYTVKGIIKSEIKPLPGIEVSISDPDGNELCSATTDSKGAFLIENVNPGKVFMDVDIEGYNPLHLELITEEKDLDLGTIILDRNITLDEVTVSAKSVVKTPDKTIVYASQVERERAASALNMLTILSYKAPQIFVNESERNITINGEVPQILVNGVKRPMEFISNIKSDAIERIEFSQMPEVRFGKRYLNIITKRPMEGIWVKADVRGAVTTPRYFYNGLVNYTRGKNDFMISYDGGYRHGSKEYVDEVEQYNSPEKTITLGMESLPSSTIDKWNTLNFYFTHLISAKSRFEATGTLNLHDNLRNRYARVTELTQVYDRTNRQGYSIVRPNLSLYYYLKASDKAVIEIDAFGSYSDNSTHRNLSYSTGYDSRLSTTGGTWYFATEALWKQTLPFGRLHTGFKYSYNDARTNYLIDGNKSKQNLHSTRMKLYSSLAGDVLTLGYSLSAGVSYYKVDEEMVSPVVSATIQKEFGNDFVLTYYFRYDPYMPPASSFNEVVVPVNELMYRVADGNLKTEHNIDNKLQLWFGKNKLSCSLQGTLINNTNTFITDYSYQNDPDAPLYGYFLERTGNGRYFRSYGVDLHASVSNLWNFLSFSAFTGWTHSMLKAYETYSLDSWHLTLRMGLYWKGWQLNFSGSNLVPSWSMGAANAKRKTWPYTSLALYKKLGNWNLQASWNNLFSRYGGRYRTETLSPVVRTSSDYRMNDQGNLFEIGVSYQFFKGKSLEKSKRSIRLSNGGEDGVSRDY